MSDDENYNRRYEDENENDTGGDFGGQEEYGYDQPEEDYHEEVEPEPEPEQEYEPDPQEEYEPEPETEEEEHEPEHEDEEEYHEPEHEEEEEEEVEPEPEPEDEGEEEFRDDGDVGDGVEAEFDPPPVDDVEVLDWTPDDVNSPEALERLEESGRTMLASADSSSDGAGGGFNIGSMIKGAMDGFGGGDLGSIVGTIQGMISSGGGGPLSNGFSSGGGFAGMAEKLIGKAAHKFLGVDESTGAIIGAIAGNVLFSLGGQNNSLGGIGKMILDNIISGKYKRQVDPFVSPVDPTRSFSLDFKTERQKCLQTATLFEDPEFPAANSSLYFKTPPRGNIEWKRPGDIVQAPQLIVDNQSRFDVKQGELGDCWLLAAAANLTLREELFFRVVPPDQSFTENYAGIFHFQFWRYGKWVDVVVDDRLPTRDGELIYMHSAQNNEFWSALLEKAYAKLYGSYEALEGGNTVEALEDFTGGLTEFFDLRKSSKETILAMLVRGMQMGALFGCSISADPSVKEAVRDDGLVRGHAYSITALHTVRTSRGDVVLVRIRNPWGNSKEWNGAWSDNAPEWHDVDPSEVPAFEKDGEFWMSFDDFFANFEDMEVCNLSASIMDEISSMTGIDEKAVDATVRHWEERTSDGRWDRKVGSAGGCSNFPASYAKNPQYASYFTVTQESVEQDGKATVIVALLQKYRRELRVKGLDSLPIGFSVFEAPSDSTPLDQHFLRNNKAVARVPVFINMREVTVRFRVVPGSYVIIPCTYEPNSEADYLIRVYANGSLQFQCIQN